MGLQHLLEVKYTKIIGDLNLNDWMEVRKYEMIIEL